MFRSSNFCSSVLFNLPPISTILGNMLKTSTNKIFSFLYHYLPIPLSPSLLWFLLSPLLLCFSFFSYSYLLNFPSLFFISFSILLLLSSSSCLSLYSLLNHSLSCSLLLFFTSSSCNAINCFCKFNIFLLFSITCYSNLITSSPTSLINSSTLIWSKIFISIVFNN